MAVGLYSSLKFLNIILFIYSLRTSHLHTMCFYHIPLQILLDPFSHNPPSPPQLHGLSFPSFIPSFLSYFSFLFFNNPLNHLVLIKYTWGGGGVHCSIVNPLGVSPLKTKDFPSLSSLQQSMVIYAG